ncbi:40-residue YVTN family beta-propeller repeat (plasmid) [Variovorax sp. SRS16]|uniref:YncE family protein n=1 Tax=Variovorax sp. SRS16 TaxID=282217 RepID=UPI001317C186|nr:YncE family protein [Variovorax sp. SRS16]VTU46402.1 40-residue YVTN family beta-propeller repeat [Variovorax sp. SRS16]
MTREILLLVEKCSHCFSYYDIGSGERLHSILLDEFPHEFVVDAATRYAYVGHYGVETSGHLGAGGTRIFQIDLAARRLARSIDIAPFNRLHGMQMDAQGRLYALSEERAQLVVLDHPERDSAPSRAVPTGGIKSHLFALTRDGQTAYVMNLLSHTVTRVRPHDATVTPLACSPGQKPEGYALSADEKTLYVTNRWSHTLAAIDTATMKVLREAPSREDATRLYLHRDGRLLVTNYGERSLSVVDPASLKEMACIPMAARAIALSFHPSRPLAFVSQDDDRIGCFNMQTLAFERFIATQREPDVSRVVML